MNWNIFWGLYTLAFAVAALLVWYFLYYRKKHYTELCSVKTTGTVVRYSAVRYNDISLLFIAQYNYQKLQSEMENRGCGHNPGRVFGGSKRISIHAPHEGVRPQYVVA